MVLDKATKEGMKQIQNNNRRKQNSQNKKGQQILYKKTDGGPPRIQADNWKAFFQEKAD